MKNRLILLLAYFLGRAGELSTWLGLITVLAVVFRKSWSADQMSAMAQNAMLAFGIIAAVFPDRIAEIRDTAAHLVAGTTPGGSNG